VLAVTGLVVTVKVMLLLPGGMVTCAVSSGSRPRPFERTRTALGILESLRSYNQSNSHLLTGAVGLLQGLGCNGR
jgi:hypothetical protein